VKLAATTALVYGWKAYTMVSEKTRNGIVALSSVGEVQMSVRVVEKHGVVLG
jgi:hypothetical protein